MADAESKSSGSGNTATIVVAALGVVSSIAVAFITSGNNFDRKFDAVQEKVDAINTDLSSAKQMMSKLQSNYDSLKTGAPSPTRESASSSAVPCPGRVFEVRGNTPITVRPTPGGGLQWSDFPGMRSQFTLEQRRTVAIYYQLSDFVQANPGGYIVTRLSVDNVSSTGVPAITGEKERYRTAQAFWVGTLDAGSHSAKIEYRAESTGTSEPENGDFAGRALYVVELGCPANT